MGHCPYAECWWILWMALDLYFGKQTSFLNDRQLTNNTGRATDYHNCLCRVLVHLELSGHRIVALERRAGFYPSTSQS
jgi:hypothetical protein